MLSFPEDSNGYPPDHGLTRGARPTTDGVPRRVVVKESLYDLALLAVCPRSFVGVSVAGEFVFPCHICSTILMFLVLQNRNILQNSLCIALRVKR